MRTAWDQYALDARCMPEPRVRGFAMRSDTRMESDSGKGAKESGVRDRRYLIRYPFAADVEVLVLEYRDLVWGVPSNLCLGGCFVLTRRTLEVLSRVCATLTLESQ